MGMVGLCEIDTHAEAETGPYHDTAGAAFWHEDRAEEECSEFVAAYIDECIVNLQLLLGVTLSEMAHIVRKHGEVIGHLVFLAEFYYDG